MRSAVLACAAAVWLSLAVHPAFSANRPSDDYFKIRDRAKVLPNADSTEIQSHPDHFADKLIEVRGVITAVAGSEAQTNLLISASDSSSPVMVALPPDRKAVDWPFLDVGTGIRALCKVVTAGGTSGSLELVMPIKEAEAVSTDQARAKAAAAKAEAIRKAALARQSKTPRKLASRGVSARTYQAGGRYSDTQLVEIYGNAVRYFNHRVAPAEAKSIARAIIDYSRRYGLDARLVMAVVAVESNFNQNAVSRCGAMGLGQLMPGTATDLGVGNAYDLRQNLDGSTRLLSAHIRNMSADGHPTDEAVKLALACYNAGVGAVRKYKGIPPYRETQDYVKKITRLYRQMCGLE